MNYTKEQKSIIHVRNSIVYKSNDLIQKSRFSLSATQQKIVLYLISQINQYDLEFKKYTFQIRDFCKICGIEYDSGKNYTAMKQAIQDLRDKSLWVTLPDGRETTISWIVKPYITKSKGIIEITLDEDLKPYLLQLKSNYTKYELIYTLHFKSKYSIRLYELIKSIDYCQKDEYIREYSIDDFRRMIDAENYTLWGNLKARVLDPSAEEINKYSDKNLRYEVLRDRGKNKVKGIRFIISTKTSNEKMEIDCAIDREMKLLNQEIVSENDLNLNIGSN